MIARDTVAGTWEKGPGNQPRRIVFLIECKKAAKGAALSGTLTF